MALLIAVHPAPSRDARARQDPCVRRTFAVLGLAVVSTSLLGACSGESTPQDPTPTPRPRDGRTPVVVDTDLGQDDMMALLYLLQRTDIRVEAITIAGTGLAHCSAGVQIALSLLDVADAESGVPIACGPEEPLPGESSVRGAFPDQWREATDAAYGIELPPSERRSSTLDAPELLRTAVAGAEAPVRLLTLGPLTNVALALRGDPAFVEQLAGVTIMGGAVDVPGNVFDNDVAEFNIWVDPVAAREVLASGVEITLVPLDATNEVPVTAFFADALARTHLTPEAETVNALFEAQPSLLSGTYFFWDPLAAALFVDPDLATLERRTIDVLEGPRGSHGQTVDDPNGPSVHVAVAADALAFEQEFLSTLNGGADVGPMRPDPVAAIGIGGAGCTYDGPTELPEGLTAVRVNNESAAAWNTIVVRIDPDHTYGDLAHAVRTFEPTDEPPSWIAFVTESPQAPGARVLAPWSLQAGTYGVLCHREDPWTLQPVTEIVAG